MDGNLAISMMPLSYKGFDMPASERTHRAYPVIAASRINCYHDKFMVKVPGITMGRSGVLVRVFFVRTDFWPLNTSVWVKEFKRVTSLYAFELLHGLPFGKLNAGSAVPTLNRNHVHTLPIMRPCNSLTLLLDKLRQYVKCKRGTKMNASSSAKSATQCCTDQYRAKPVSLFKKKKVANE